MATYYVSFSIGDDSYDGLSGTDDGGGVGPWKTIGKVNGENFSAGDFIYFRRGDTWTGETLIPPDSGSSGSPITFGAYYTGNDPIIDGDTPTKNYCIDVNNRDWLVFENIEVHSGAVANFYIHHNQTDNITLNNITSSGNTTSGIYVIQAVTQIDFTDCTANADNGSCTYGFRYGAAYGTLSGCEASGCTYGFRLDTSTGGDTTLTQCSAHDNITSGVQFVGSTSSSYHVYIKRSDIYDNATGILLNTNVQDVRISYCKIYTNTSYGIGIYNNGTSDDAEIWNCTFYDNGGPGVYTDIDDTDVYGCIFQDNDDDTNNWQVQITGNPTTWDLDYNWYYDAGTTTNRLASTNYTTIASWRTALSGGGGGTEQNSDFADPGMNNPASDDFSLTSTSACIDEGYDWGQLEDYLGASESGTEWDVGCLEHQLMTLTITSVTLTGLDVDLTEEVSGETIDLEITSLTLSGLSPTLAAPANITTTVAPLTLSGLSPTLAAPASITVTLAELTLAGLNTSLYAPVTINVTLAEAALAALNTTVDAPAAITAAIVEATLSALSPTTSMPATVTATLAEIVLFGLTPDTTQASDMTAVITEITISALNVGLLSTDDITLQIAPLTLSGLNLSLDAPTSIDLAITETSLDGLNVELSEPSQELDLTVAETGIGALNVDLTAPVTIQAALGGELALSAFDVALSAPASVTLSIAQTLISALNPTLSAPVNIDITLAEVSFAVLTPSTDQVSDITVTLSELTTSVLNVSLSEENVISLTTAEVTLSGLNVSLSAPTNITLGLAELSLEALNPRLNPPDVSSIVAYDETSSIFELVIA